ncbi:RusA family crossover junction endodeoxyribonuclease [Bacillus sp. CH126_4D]|nr:RusA family crossover junction endodeoxyribonuclease [Bacillus sp. CH140a_4T]KAB2474222.1 RusA family crossover junction endodeoxyribonuclease [Bacillus sp. CH126_4D]
MITFTVFGEPVAQGRPRASTINGRVRMYDPKKLRDFKQYVKLVASEHAPANLLEGALVMKVKVYKPSLKSFSKKKALQAEQGLLRPTVKPDVDNYIKRIKDAMQKELREVSKLYEDLKKANELLAKEHIAETKLRLETEDALKLSQDQLQSREEDYSTLLNEFNAITEKNHELEHDLRKMHINVRAAKEREHRLELQGRSQALGMALKAVL